MQGRQRVMCSKPWAAAKRARQKVLLIDRRQDVGNTPLEDAVTDAWHPERAPLLLARLRDVGPSHRRWPVPLGVQRPPRSIDVMRQTGKTELGFLPSFRCYPFESR